MIKREIIAEKPFKNSNTKPDPHTCGFCRDVFVEAEEKTPWSNAFKDVVVNKTVSQISHFASHHCTFFQLIWNTVTAHQRISSFEIPSEESSLAIVAAFRRPDTIHNLHDYDRMLLQVGRTDKNSLKYVGAFDLYAPSTDPASVDQFTPTQLGRGCRTELRSRQILDPKLPFKTTRSTSCAPRKLR
jgi:hypothetical protein